MTFQPEQLPLHLSEIETSKGKWLIAVYGGAEVLAGGTILLKLILEQTIDKGEHFRARELGMILLVPELHDPDLFAEVVDRIRHWIETTEGDGFLDVVNR
jgi:hypothetical protein